MTAAATMAKRPRSAPAKGGPDSADSDVSLRRCIVSREPQPKEGLIRFVVAPDGTLTPDLAETLPGRGIWVTASRAAIETARAKKLFGRAARSAVRCVALLGLLNRAGQLAAGKLPVREWLRGGKAAILLTAADSDGRDAAELRRLARGAETVDVLKAVELGRAVGRDHFVHMAAAPGRLAQSLIRETRRLAGLREGGAR